MGVCGRVAVFAGLLGAMSVGTGCAVGTQAKNCNVTLQFLVSPLTATADHSAMPPGNQVQFRGEGSPTAPEGCPIPAYIVPETASWQNPDPADITISSANDTTNGTAVCTGATKGAVTLTGTFSPQVVNAAAGSGSPQTVATVQLTCK